MSQKKYWEKEYQNPLFLSNSREPNEDFLRFLRWLKDNNYDFVGKVIFDAGCGNGRHIIYLAKNYAAAGFGYDLSATAIGIAKETIDEDKDLKKRLDFKEASIGETLPFNDESVDIILDLTSSPSLYEGERKTFIQETHRILKDDGYFHTRILLKDGDRNAKNLIKTWPGPEKDTYINPTSLIVEHVYSEKDFRTDYEPFFQILHLKKSTGYQRWGTDVYKRRYLNAYLKKK